MDLVLWRQQELEIFNSIMTHSKPLWFRSIELIHQNRQQDDLAQLFAENQPQLNCIHIWSLE